MNSNKSISILGCGWLGFELAKLLLINGFDVKGSTTNESKLTTLSKAGVQPFLIDLGKAIPTEYLSFFKSDILFLNIPPGRRSPDLLSKYPDRIQKALRYAKSNDCKKCILVSSTGVFESQSVLSFESNFPIYDKDVPNGNSKSAQVLIQGERLLQSIFKDSGTVIRFGGLVGGDRIAGRFLAGRKNLSNGSAPVNMIHRDDCLQIVQNIIIQNHWGKNLNAVADLHPSRSAFYSKQAIKYGFSKPTFDNSEIAEGKIISNEYLKSVLDYKFIHPDPMAF